MGRIDDLLDLIDDGLLSNAGQASDDDVYVYDPSPCPPECDPEDRGARGHAPNCPKPNYPIRRCS